ncbi:ATP-binding protein [Aeromonas enteropelogenes]|uniref:ATP-binding protein n=1 Tax=Aeromonas enteropelogenes TaxID=29489 RepID=UPI003BA3BBE3
MNTEHPQANCELDFETLVETCELECKLAQGAGGKGELPKDFWRTYSGMANTKGGVVLLGVREKDGRFTVAGIENIEKVKQDLFNQLTNPSKVSINLLSEDDVITLNQGDKQFLYINIPAATRKQKPVFINNNMFSGTFRRLYDGDHHCSEDTVKRMIAEQIEDDRDAKILEHFTIDDLDMDSVSAYRNIFSAVRPNHAWLALDTFDFLKMQRCWLRDRYTGKEGLTVAGLLMFGKWNSIQDAIPSYFIEYQEKSDSDQTRWIDRIVPDGTWSGNIFDFYRKVYRKLVADVKLKFSLKDGIRSEDSPVHIALREALVNTLVHADYSDTTPIQIIKRPDMFSFRNPGSMRVPLELAVQGSNSDCRNKILHHMFLMIGLGERAGSGIPKIFSGWSENQWQPPRLIESYQPDQTLLELNMVDLIPSHIISELSINLGDRFKNLSRLEQLILAVIKNEPYVTHDKMCQVSGEHPRSVTLALSKLERQNLISSTGSHKNKVYHKHDVELVSPEHKAGQDVINEQFLHEPDRLIKLSGSDVENIIKDIRAYSEEVKRFSKESKGELDAERQREIESAYLEKYSHFKRTVESVAWGLIIAEVERYNLIPKREITKEMTRALISNICNFGFLTLTDISNLLGRKPASLRRDYLTPMIKDGVLYLAFPHAPTHPQQGYKTVPGKTSYIKENANNAEEES